MKPHRPIMLLMFMASLGVAADVPPSQDDIRKQLRDLTHTARQHERLAQIIAIGEPAVDPVLEYLTEKSANRPAAIAAALEAWKKQSAFDNPAFRQKVLAAAPKLMRGDERNNFTLVELLGRDPQLVPLIATAAAEQPRSMDRQHFAKLVGMIDPTYASFAPALAERYRKSTDAYVRRNALRALQSIGATDTLIDLASGASMDEQFTLMEAINEMNRSASDRAVEFAKAMLIVPTVKQNDPLSAINRDRLRSSAAKLLMSAGQKGRVAFADALDAAANDEETTRSFSHALARAHPVWDAAQITQFVTGKPSFRKTFQRVARGMADSYERLDVLLVEILESDDPDDHRFAAALLTEWPVVDPALLPRIIAARNATTNKQVPQLIDRLLARREFAEQPLVAQTLGSSLSGPDESAAISTFNALLNRGSPGRLMLARIVRDDANIPAQRLDHLLSRSHFSNIVRYLHASNGRVSADLGKPAVRVAIAELLIAEESDAAAPFRMVSQWAGEEDPVRRALAQQVVDSPQMRQDGGPMMLREAGVVMRVTLSPTPPAAPVAAQTLASSSVTGQSLAWGLTAALMFGAFCLASFLLMGRKANEAPQRTGNAAAGSVA